MRELDDMDGFRIGGTVVNNLRYDTVIIAESEEYLQRLINVVVTKSEEKGLYLNSAKSFTMGFRRHHNSLHATSMSTARYWNKCTRLYT